MAKFVYLGDLDETVMGTRAFGLAFPVGVAVEVTDPHAVAKLTGNPRFEAVADEAQAVTAARHYLSCFQGAQTEWQAPPAEALRHVVPENRVRVYDTRAAMQGIADEAPEIAVAVRNSDVVLGTSAGSAVGAQLGSTLSIGELFEQALTTDPVFDGAFAGMTFKRSPCTTAPA